MFHLSLNMFGLLHMMFEYYIPSTQAWDFNIDSGKGTTCLAVSALCTAVRQWQLLKVKLTLFAVNCRRIWRNGASPEASAANRTGQAQSAGPLGQISSMSRKTTRQPRGPENRGDKHKSSWGHRPLPATVANARSGHYTWLQYVAVTNEYVEHRRTA